MDEMDDIQVPGIFDRLQNVDLEDLDGLDDAGLRGHFRELADSAKTSQLRMILGPIDAGIDDEAERPGIVETYVERRVAAVLRLRASRDEIRGIFNGE